MSSFHNLSQNYGDLVLDALGTLDTWVPLKTLRRSFLVDIGQHVAVQTVFAGQVIFEDGAYDGQHIFLKSGEVVLEYPAGRREQVSAGATDLALAHAQPRPCRCSAETDCVVLRLDSDRVDRTVSWSQISDYLLSEFALRRELENDMEWIQTVLNSNLFLKVPPVNAERIFSRLTPMTVSAGEVIIQQGDIGDCCYFIKEGEADVMVFDRAEGTSSRVAEIREGRCFGEDALVNATVRNATVTMTSDGVLMRLEKNDFMTLMEDPAVEALSRDELRSTMEAPIYVDLRSEEEYNAGHIPSSANIPLSLLSIKKRQMAPEKLHVLYCDTGRRSNAAAYLLGKLGYNVVALLGGIDGSGYRDTLIRGENHILRNGELVAC